jgi:hypothetical protein
MVKPENTSNDEDGNGCDPLSDPESSAFDEFLQSLWNSNENTAPDEFAPPVDESRLIAFVQGTLPAEDRPEIIDLIATYRTWRSALSDILSRPPLADPDEDGDSRPTG